MKTIEEVAFDRYLSDQSLPAHKRMDTSCYIDWAQLGAREAQRWIDVNDRDNPMPANTDFLIKLEDGQIFRFNEDWSDEMKIVTHWRPFERL
ncbi:MAG TPA: hypothetical protein VFC67_14760 [Prolixibacteraceae bacterium]|nr:hypothetical protein [Prolixibacteraceae bacterium]